MASKQLSARPQRWRGRPRRPAAAPGAENTTVHMWPVSFLLLFLRARAPGTLPYRYGKEVTPYLLLGNGGRRASGASDTRSKMPTKANLPHSVAFCRSRLSRARRFTLLTPRGRASHWAAFEGHDDVGVGNQPGLTRSKDRKRTLECTLMQPSCQIECLRQLCLAACSSKLQTDKR